MAVTLKKENESLLLVKKGSDVWFTFDECGMLCEARTEAARISRHQVNGRVTPGVGSGCAGSWGKSLSVYIYLLLGVCLTVCLSFCPSG